MKELSAGEVGFLCANIKDWGMPAWAIPSRWRNVRRSLRFPASRKCSPWSSAGFIPRTRRITKTQVRAGKTPAQRRRLFLRAGNLSALGFGFRCASSGCCTWKSSRNGWNGNSRWNSSPRRLQYLQGGYHGRQNPEPSTTHPNARSRENFRPVRAVCQNGYPCAQRICGQCVQTVRGKARYPEKYGLSYPEQGNHHLRTALCGNRVRLFRPSEVRHARLCLLGLRTHRLP